MQDISILAAVSTPETRCVQ